MNAVSKLSQRLRALCRRSGPDSTTGARRGLRLGITARLTISFVGVAALILAANLVVQRGILVERTVRVIALAPPPAPAVVAPPPVRTEPAPEVVAVPPQPAVSAQLLEDTLAALARFNQALQLRLSDDTPAGDMQFRQASMHLTETATQVINASARSSAGGSASRLRVQLRALAAHASALAKTADARRDAESHRAQLLEAVNSHVRQPLAAAWTIFGRVVARQSLVQLGDDLDSLRQHSEPLQAATPISAAQDAAIDAAEQRVRHTLAENEASFRRGQTDAWYQALSSDMEQLVGLRKNSVALSEELAQGVPEVTEQGNQLRQALFKMASEPAAVTPAPRQSAPVATSIVPVSHQISSAPVPVPLPQPRETTSFSHASGDDSSRRLIAWASGLAALLMLGMCVGIVVSIVSPVRRLLQATAQIAAGEYSVRVASGGISELDTLASAFNAMADKLARAEDTNRRYQLGLESKIRERTRSLQELAEHDPLTGLPNRRHLFKLLDEAIGRAKQSGQLVGVLFLDVDNFKYINDGLGHAFGDNVLMQMSERLALITSRFGFAARLGGDEFTVVLENASTIAEVASAGEALVAAFHDPLMVEGRELMVSISVGACAYPIHAQEAASLLKAADMALFQAKSLGRSRLSLFTPDLLDVAAAKFTTEQGLRRAIDRGEFELFFQPEINAETLEISLVEALIRWRSPSGELLLPGAFLNVAEESGLAIEIGDWVLRTAIRSASDWHRGTWPNARVAVNVSPRQLADGRFVERLGALLEEFHLPPRCIEVELTESILQTGQTTVDSLYKLRELGVAVALDDFGTGFSSLASLEVLPLTRVKLDRSLISGIDTSHRSAAIAEAIIGMCQRLGLEITAEGVERPEQFAYLARQRAMCIQGFLLTCAVPRDELLSAFGTVRERARELVFTARETAITASVTGATGLTRDSSTGSPSVNAA